MTRIGAKCTALGSRYEAYPVENTILCIGCVAAPEFDDKGVLVAPDERLCHALDDCTGDSKHAPVIWKLVKER